MHTPIEQGKQTQHSPMFHKYNLVGDLSQRCHRQSNLQETQCPLTCLDGEFLGWIGPEIVAGYTEQ